MKKKFFFVNPIGESDHDKFLILTLNLVFYIDSTSGC